MLKQIHIYKTKERYRSGSVYLKSLTMIMSVLAIGTFWLK